MTKNSRNFHKNCIFCGKPFIGAKPFGKFCSDKCRVYYSVQKRAFEENTKEQLPSLLNRLKISSLELGDTGISYHELESAISLILQAQSKLISAAIPIKSFDEHLFEKTNGRTGHNLNGETGSLKEFKREKEKVKEKEVFNVIDRAKVILDNSPKIKEELQINENPIIEKQIQPDPIIKNQLEEKKIETENKLDSATFTLEQPKSIVKTGFGIVSQIKSLKDRLYAFSERNSVVTVNELPIGKIEKVANMVKQIEENSENQPEKIEIVRTQQEEVKHQNDVETAKAWLNQFMKKGGDKMD